MPGLERKRAFRGRGDEHRVAGMGRAGRRPINTWARTRFLRHLGQGAHRRVCPAFTVALCSQQPLPPAPGGRCCPGTNALYGWAVPEEGSTSVDSHHPQNSEAALEPSPSWQLRAPREPGHMGRRGVALPPPAWGAVHGGKSQEKQPDLENQSPPGDPSFQSLCWGMVPSP